MLLKGEFLVIKVAAAKAQQDCSQTNLSPKMIEENALRGKRI